MKYLPKYPASLRVKGLKPALIYAAFAGFCFVVFLHLTFPYAPLRRRLIQEASLQGVELSIGNLGPAFFGISARDVRLGIPTYLSIPRLVLRPALIPLGVGFDAEVLGGRARGAIGSRDNPSIQLDLSHLKLSASQLKSLGGIDLEGDVTTHLDLRLPKASPPKAEGDLVVDIKGLTLRDSTLKNSFLGLPDGIDLPRTELGSIKATFKIVKGTVTLDNGVGKGNDLDLWVRGTLKLAQSLPYSEMNIDLKVKANPDYVKRLGPLGMGLSILPADKELPDFRLLQLGGFLGTLRAKNVSLGF